MRILLDDEAAKQHGDAPYYDAFDGTDGEEQGASTASVNEPSHHNASENLSGRCTLGDRSEPYHSVVSGNPLPQHNLSSINVQRCEREGDTRHGHTTTAEICHTASQAPSEVSGLGDGCDRRGLRPLRKRTAPPHSGALGNRPRAHRPLSVRLTDAARIDHALAAEGERLVARIIAQHRRSRP
jgi:hypothetical protein